MLVQVEGKTEDGKDEVYHINPEHVISVTQADGGDVHIALSERREITTKTDINVVVMTINNSLKNRFK
jgi:hypothetical protein